MRSSWVSRGSTVVDAGLPGGRQAVDPGLPDGVAPEDSLDSLRSDDSRRTLIGMSLNLVPFAGIAFLWFIGVVREQLGEVEDRLFSTVFLGSGLLFLAMLFAGAVSSTSLLEMLAGSNVNADVWSFGRNNAQALVSVYALRMAAVFTLSVSSASLRTTAVPRWVSFLGYLVALVLLFAAGEQKWAQLVFPAWVLLLSIVILFSRRATASTTVTAIGT